MLKHGALNVTGLDLFILITQSSYVLNIKTLLPQVVDKVMDCHLVDVVMAMANILRKQVAATPLIWLVLTIVWLKI